MPDIEAQVHDHDLEPAEMVVSVARDAEASARCSRSDKTAAAKIICYLFALA
jgi:hypothetical protein